MSECRLLDENGRSHFMTKRFDRDGTRKHHLQTLCALDHLDYKAIGTHDYAQFFQVIRQLDLGPDAAAQAFRRMAFNVMAANCDDHTKNISFILREGGAWRLAPAYDLTHAHDVHNPWLREHLMAVDGKFGGITIKDLFVVGDRFEVPGIKPILQEVSQAVSRWKDFAAAAGVPTETAAAIEADHRLLA
jgi:serine/threonine-protein kinase HipA